jgi:vacuolar-type H+-ATPase subunit I/STV1
MEKKEKPLEKMTAKELREVALEIPEIEGVHAMKKEDLLEAIRKFGGVEKEEAKEEVKEEKEEAAEAEEEAKEEKEEAKEKEQEAKRKEQEAKKKEKEEAKKKEKEEKVAAHVADLKKKIREFKALKEEAIKKRDARMAEIYKRRINRLKKRTRKAA